MLAGILNWIIELPPAAVYLVIGLLAAVENIFPPFPADTVVALGAFLSHRGLVDPWLIFLVTLVSNIVGAMAMYFLAARHAPALFRSRLAQRFLPADGLARIRVEYDRFGVLGLFIGRLLPGFRSVVAPFAGLIHVGPWRAGIAMTVASALWYGGIVLVASALGSRLDQILETVSNLNRGLAIVAGAALVALAVWIWRRRRARQSDETD